LGRVAPVLGELSRRAAANAPCSQTLPEPPPPGIVILDQDLRQIASTPAARVWLDRLIPHAEAVLGAIVGRALRVGDQADRLGSCPSACLDRRVGDA
jgi:hypothetical protein